VDLIKDDIFAGAFLLDPRYRDILLDDLDFDEGKNYLANLQVHNGKILSLSFLPLGCQGSHWNQQIFCLEGC
jgi:hypothetical protein